MMSSIFWAVALVYFLKETNGSPYMLVEGSPAWINIYWQWTSAVTHPDSSSISNSLLCFRYYLSVFKQTPNLHRETPAWVSNPVLFKCLTPAGATTIEKWLLGRRPPALTVFQIVSGWLGASVVPPLTQPLLPLGSGDSVDSNLLYKQRKTQNNVCKLCLEPSRCSAVSVGGV